jgi:hypothetical protein
VTAAGQEPERRSEVISLSAMMCPAAATLRASGQVPASISSVPQWRAVAISGDSRPPVNLSRILQSLPRCRGLRPGPYALIKVQIKHCRSEVCCLPV